MPPLCFSSASPHKWNTYISHHCGLHKCLKVINISSSVRLMCLVIGYLCCGLPLSKPPLHFGICVCVTIYSIHIVAMGLCDFISVCVCACLCTGSHVCAFCFFLFLLLFLLLWFSWQEIVSSRLNSGFIQREKCSVCLFVWQLEPFVTWEVKEDPHRRESRLLECSVQRWNDNWLSR